jgi:hypothetical protein
VDISRELTDTVQQLATVLLDHRSAQPTDDTQGRPS